MGVIPDGWAQVLAGGPYDAVLLADRADGGWALVGWASREVTRSRREAFERALEDAGQGWVSVTDATALPAGWAGAVAAGGRWIHGRAEAGPGPCAED